MDDWECEDEKWRVARDEPIRYLLEEASPEALRMLDNDQLDVATVMACLERAFAGLTSRQVNAEVGAVIAARWLQRLQDRDWTAYEAFKRRWDMWEYLADERGVSLPPADPAWSFGDDGRPVVLPSDRTVKRRLMRLGVLW